MAILCKYSYDPLDRVSSLTPLAQAVARRFYSGERLMTELQGGTQRTFFQAGGHLLAQQHLGSDGVATTLIAGDRHNSVLHASGAGRQADIAYSPYGHHDAAQPIAGLPGFNGEKPDPFTGHYLLGNGYRAYNPVLRRFNSPDSLSPFGEGGVNAYAYALNNPINQIDPTGHIPFGVSSLLGLVFGVGGGAAIATSISVKESDSTLSDVLMAVGVVSVILGAGMAAKAISKGGGLKQKAAINKRAHVSEMADLQKVYSEFFYRHYREVNKLTKELNTIKALAYPSYKALAYPSYQSAFRHGREVQTFLDLAWTRRGSTTVRSKYSIIRFPDVHNSIDVAPAARSVRKIRG
ncbi:RHS repeat-associated core domain-containing protein [Pseudomonas syringae]|uniref:RHS repeat-associated core domain-containing protein n=1 Tax=Pseudomonas syringae TaxID=317 RepID=UPI001FD88360|nr:RHS repeat-associated core domain-containing protein [Pseudomonas syringae]MCI3947631.1 RHS repeat-associated core domain-containing protein [Pseudomonas syringae]